MSYNSENPDSDKIQANPTATTGNKPANPATQLQPTSCQSFNAENSDSDKISANPTATTGNKPANSETAQTTKPHPDNLIRQGEVCSRPVYIKPSWPFREDSPRNKYRY